MILLCSIILLGAAVLAYGKRSKVIPLILLFPYLGTSVYVTADLLLPGSPVLFWGIVIVGAALPLLFLTIIVLDCRYGLFSLDTFFGIVLVIGLPPFLLVANLAATLAKAVQAA